MKLLFLIILTLNLNYSFGKYGGNDIFTSLEAMKILWARDIELVNKMETIIQNMKEVIPHMERYTVDTDTVNHIVLKISFSLCFWAPDLLFDRL